MFKEKLILTHHFLLCIAHTTAIHLLSTSPAADPCCVKRAQGERVNNYCHYHHLNPDSFRGSAKFNGHSSGNKATCFVSWSNASGNPLANIFGLALLSEKALWY